MKKPGFVQVIFLLSFIVGTFLSTAPIALAAPRKFCSDILSGDWKKTDSGVFVRSNSNSTSNLISYFEQLIERQILKNRGLLRIIDGFKQNKFINPISKEEAVIDSALQIHREAIEEYFENTVLDKETILKWAQNALYEKDHVTVKRDETRVKTEDIHQKMQFHFVPAGSFQKGNEGRKVWVNLTHPFEAMSTQVTQKQWVELMGENPAYFASGGHTITAVVNGKRVLMQPNHPIENITWWSAVEFANRLSKKHGLVPAYDLSQVKFKKNTYAEDGSYKAESGGFQIVAPNSDIYQTSGYRLPTEAEQEYLLRAMGKADGLYFFGDDAADLENYAWFNKNSKKTTQPVATLAPLIINGKEFFDLYGNVWEWSNDLDSSGLVGGEIPTGPISGFFRKLRGGSYQNNTQILESHYCNVEQPNNRDYDIGFRLVRSIK